ncbi:protein Mis18-beta [Tachyglossus aculeatus]|uniref:protein Mis18-beta n=1 Tax=Tachyglossus aculeatus TaxID=9261 RepID=UPI0018F683D3|nr:protein Mis18-beta [Tachyglossus aculeatus]
MAARRRLGLLFTEARRSPRPRAAGRRMEKRPAAAAATPANSGWDTQVVAGFPGVAPKSPEEAEPQEGAGAAAEEARCPLARAPALPWGLRPKDCVVFQCRGCHSVLGDSLHLCGEEAALLHVLVCSRVTDEVVLEESLLVGIEGVLTGSTYHPLFCRSCKLGLGFHLYSSSASLASWRGLFCLAKDKIVCYLLETRCMVEASEMTFPTVDISANIEKLRGEIVVMHGRLEALTERLGELAS